MTRGRKVAVVLVGYGLAMLAGCGSSWLYDEWAARQPYDTSGGMYAAGSMLAGLCTFLLVALAPTALAGWYLWVAVRRRMQRARDGGSAA